MYFLRIWVRVCVYLVKTTAYDSVTANTYIINYWPIESIFLLNNIY